MPTNIMGTSPQQTKCLIICIFPGRKIDFKAQQIWFVRDPAPNFSIKEESEKKFHTLSGQNSLKKARSNSFSCIRFSSSFNFLNIFDNVFDFFRVFVARFCSFSFGVELITGFCFFSAPMPRLSCFTCVSMGCNLPCSAAPNPVPSFHPHFFSNWNPILECRIASQEIEPVPVELKVELMFAPETEHNPNPRWLRSSLSASSFRLPILSHTRLQKSLVIWQLRKQNGVLNLQFRIA